MEVGVDMCEEGCNPHMGSVCAMLVSAFTGHSLVMLCLTRSLLAFPGWQLDGSNLTKYAGFFPLMRSHGDSISVCSSVCTRNWFSWRLSKQKRSRNTLLFKGQTKC